MSGDEYGTDQDLHIGKADLAEALVGIHPNGLALSRRHAKFVVEMLSETISGALTEGKVVHLPGIGGIRQRAVPGRSGVGPGGKPYETGPSISLSIRPAAEMKRRLNPGALEPEAADETVADATGAP